MYLNRVQISQVPLFGTEHIAAIRKKKNNVLPVGVSYF